MRRMLTVGAIAALSMFDWPARAAEACAGDCDGDGAVAINELVRGVAIALGGASPDQCGAADANADGTVTIAELIGAVNAALAGCDGASATRTPTPVRTATPSPTASVFVPGCDNGRFEVTYRNVSADSNVVTSSLTLDLVAAGQVRDSRSGYYLWAITGLQCGDNMRTLTRGIQVQYLPVPTGFAPGTYTLKPPLSSFIYQESDDSSARIRAWDTASTTLTIEAVDGDTVTFRIAASMKPLPLFSLGDIPKGTFDIEVRGTVERFTSQ